MKLKNALFWKEGAWRQTWQNIVKPWTMKSKRGKKKTKNIMWSIEKVEKRFLVCYQECQWHDHTRIYPKQIRRRHSQVKIHQDVAADPTNLCDTSPISHIRWKSIFTLFFFLFISKKAHMQVADLMFEMKMTKRKRETCWIKS